MNSIITFEERMYEIKTGARTKNASCIKTKSLASFCFKHDKISFEFPVQLRSAEYFCAFSAAFSVMLQKHVAHPLWEMAPWKRPAKLCMHLNIHM